MGGGVNSKSGLRRRFPSSGDGRPSNHGTIGLVRDDVLRVEAGWLTAALLAAMASVAAWGVTAAGWDPGLWSLWLMGVLGVGAGWALARSRFPGWLAIIFFAVYGLFVVGLFSAFSLSGTWHARSLEVVER